MECIVCHKEYKSGTWLQKHQTSKHSSFFPKNRSLTFKMQTNGVNLKKTTILPSYLLHKIVFYSSKKSHFIISQIYPELLDLQESESFWKNKFTEKYTKKNINLFDKQLELNKLQIPIKLPLPPENRIDDSSKILISFGRLWMAYEFSLCMKCMLPMKQYSSPNKLCFICDSSRVEENINNICDEFYILGEDLKNVPRRGKKTRRFFEKDNIVPIVKEIYGNDLKKLHIKKCQIQLDIWKKIELQKEIDRKRQLEANVRRKQLELALAKVNMKIRSDSKLCSGFINGRLDPHQDLDYVVDMCQEMRWLFEHTPYKKTLDKAVKAYAEQLYYNSFEEDEYGYEYGYSEYDGFGEARHEAWETVEPEVRKNILKKYPKPSVYPWMRKK